MFRASLVAVAMLSATSAHAGPFGGVKKADLQAWVGVPVEALDMHPLFISMNLEKRTTENGVEIRNYRNGGPENLCSGGAFSTGQNTFSNTRCISRDVVCNNIFYIKDGKVLEYAPTGSCYTDKTVRPQSRYLEMIQK